MNKVHWFSLAALVILVIALPVYGMSENQRMATAQEHLRDRYLVEGIDLYVTNCASCHGSSGEGIGMLPPLNNPALVEARTDMLFNVIARATHGTAMASWHVDEGGILNDYQVNEMVTVIQHVDWSVVERVAGVRGFVEPSAPAVETGMAYLQSEAEEDPHQCIDCHEEPAMHAELFGINCGRCHNTVTWKPAVLTKHNFLLDHGGNGEVDCKTCHADNYIKYDCYACHEDHQAEEMIPVHNDENIFEFANCATCHPTGVSGEAGILREAQQNDEIIVGIDNSVNLNLETKLIDPELLQIPTAEEGR